LDGGADVIDSETGPFASVEEELIKAGLAYVEPGEYTKLVAVAPAAAAQLVLRHAAEKIGEWHQDASRTVHNLLKLDSGGQHPLAEVITDATRILPLVDDIQRSATEELLSCEIPISAGSVCLPRLSPAASSPPPVWRTVFTTGYLDPQWQHIVDTTVRLGGRVRVVDGAPMKLLIADRSRALIPLDRPGVAGVVHFHAPVIVDALVTLFEAIWERAVPYPPNSVGDDNLTPFERHIATLLCTGVKDDDLAAMVHVSVRTVRRHIASIMDKLDVTTRFAAGVQLVKRGWI
ncbi:MAG TPA: helix-turn-helix transcriptional regulator, partial [Pseudonocardiaceae bacterium]|nr:helix-turn-helix transcriptional regulator [Pseudonocardiaceae bacterium]